MIPEKGALNAVAAFGIPLVRRYDVAEPCGALSSVPNLSVLLRCQREIKQVFINSKHPSLICRLKLVEISLCPDSVPRCLKLSYSPAIEPAGQRRDPFEAKPLVDIVDPLDTAACREPQHDDLGHKHYSSADLIHVADLLRDRG